ncbi:MAG: tetratricopeptide repeat protein [Bacteroidetes bacterium]|jgi:tetratricopeptide (TPR) repeat protein|nr:tetratricopeptide repeat protein [Bacteroidota bacterium]
MKATAILSFLVVSMLNTATAQNAYFKMGQQAFFDGDFKSAVAHLEKSCIIDSTNASALWMLGYSYYHSENYRKSIQAFNKVIAIKPADGSAYYYRARAKSYFAKDSRLSDQDKEKNLLGAILDYTKAIAVDPNNTQDNTKYYQNRAIAYRDYSDFKLQPGSRFYDKNLAINSLKASIQDFEKVLTDNPSRQDISNLMESAKAKLGSINVVTKTARH